MTNHLAMVVLAARARQGPAQLANPPRPDTHRSSWTFFFFFADLGYPTRAGRVAGIFFFLWIPAPPRISIKTKKP
jgi:hypothetical protein